MQRQLLVVSTAMMFAFATQTMVLTLLPLSAVRLGASVGLIGILGALIALLPLLSSLYIGHVIDRSGFKRPLLLGLGALAAVPLVVTFAPSLWSLALVQAFVGWSHLVSVVAAQTYVAQMPGCVSHERRYGTFTVFASLGQLLGPMLAGALVDVRGYVTAYSAAGAISLLGGLVFLLGTWNQADVRGMTSTGLAGSVSLLMKLPSVRGAIAASATVVLLVSMFQLFFPVRLQGLNQSATLIGLLISIRALSSIIVRPFIAWFVDVLGSRMHTFLFMILAGGMAVSTLGVSSAVAMFVLAAITLGVVHGVVLPLSMVAMVERVPSELKGTSLGLRLTGNYATQFFGPLGLGGIAATVGVTSMLMAGLIIVVPACLFLWRHAETGTDLRDR